MPYAKTKDGSLVNEVTLGDGYPLSNDLQPLKIGGEASILGISSPLPDGSDSGLFRVDGDLDITGTLKTKLSHDLIYDFDDEVNTLAQAKIDALIDSAPAALDTLNELAAALNDDASFSTTVTNSLALKAPLAAPAFTGNATFAGVSDFNDRVDINETAFPQLRFSDDGGTDILNMGQSGEAFYLKTSDTNNNIRFRRSDNEDLLELDMSALRVGIGTTSPATHLDVFHTSAPEITIRGDADNSGALCFGDTYYKAGRIVYGHTNNEMELMTASDTKLKLGANQVDVYKDLNLASGEVYKIDGTTVLTNDTLSSAVVNSSLTSVGTLGSLTVSGDATFDTSTLKVDATNNRVGIGTASPDDALDIGISGSDARIYFSGNAGGGGSGILYKDAGGSSRYALHFEDDDKVILSNRASNGTVQIRANTSTAGASGEQTIATFEDDQVSIAGDTNITGDLTVSSSSDPSVIIEDPNGSGLLRLRRTDVSKNFDISLQGNDLRFTPTDTNGTMNVLIGVNASSSTIDSRLGVGNATPAEMLDVTGNALISGNVGIGTTSPTTTLDVDGTVSYKHTAITSSSDSIDVSGTTVLECDSSGGHVTIGGFTGGVQGQILYVVKTTTDLNRVILENNEGGGSQDIYLTTGLDVSLGLPGGIALYCNGSDWFALDK